MQLFIQVNPRLRVDSSLPQVEVCFLYTCVHKSWLWFHDILGPRLLCPSDSSASLHIAVWNALFQHGMPPFHCTMVSWHGIMAWMKGRIPDFSKTQGQKICFALKPIWVIALSQIFSQIYITRPCLQFCRPPKIPRFFSVWKFSISDFSGSGQDLAGKTWKPKIWNTKFCKWKKSRNFGRPAEL